MHRLGPFLISIIILLQNNCFAQSNLLVKVKKDNLYGFVNPSGKTIIDIKYEVVGDFHHGLAFFKEKGRFGFINKKGEVIVKPIYSSVSSFNEGRATICTKTSDEKTFHFLNNVCGYIDTLGNEIIPMQYDIASDFYNGVAAVHIGDSCGYIDPKGNWAIDLQYSDCEDFDKLPVTIVTTQDYDDIYIDLKNNDISTDELDGIDVMDQMLSKKYTPENRFPFKSKTNNLYGLENFEGEILFNPYYDYIYKASEEIHIVKKDGKWGAINFKNKEIIKPKYDALNRFSEGIACFKLNGKWGLLNKKGKVILDPIYEEIGNFRNGYVWFLDNGKQGYLDINGKVIVEAIYSKNTKSYFN